MTIGPSTRTSADHSMTTTLRLRFWTNSTIAGRTSYSRDGKRRFHLFRKDPSRDYGQVRSRTTHSRPCYNKLSLSARIAQQLFGTPHRSSMIRHKKSDAHDKNVAKHNGENDPDKPVDIPVKSRLRGLRSLIAYLAGFTQTRGVTG